MSYYRLEGIINYPKLEPGMRFVKKTKTEVPDVSFSMQLLLGENAKATLKSINDHCKTTYPHANFSSNILDIIQKEKEILGKDYKKRVSVKGWASFSKFLDLYQQPFDPVTLQSGDKVLLQVKISQVTNEEKAPGKKFIRLSPHILTVVEKGSYKLYDPEASFAEKNNDYFEEVKKYKKEEELSEEIEESEKEEEESEVW